MDWIKDVDASWTLFLDRDGVINEEVKDDYVRTISEMKMYHYAAPAIAMLNCIFGRVIVATNQRCVGRGIITEQVLADIHDYMLQQLALHSAHVAAIYHAPDVNGDAVMRKPNIGMATKAAAEFTDVVLSKSIMVGNSPSDIAFGKNAGMRTVFVETTQDGSSTNADIILPDLMAFAELLSKQNL